MSQSASVYQKRPVTLQQVIERIEVGDPAQVSPVILSVSPCRSGTTVLLRVFGAVGVTAHYQELKNVMRWLMQGEYASWKLPQQPQQRLYLKETIGPYTQIEAGFNPLDVLIGAGYPLDKLHMLILGRAPLNTWLSWDLWWRGRTSVSLFVQAYRTTEQIRQQAYELGLPTTVFVYESLRDNSPETVIRGMFGRLGVEYRPTAVRDWTQLPTMGKDGSGVVFPVEPPVFDVPHLHDQAVLADGLSFTSRDDRLTEICSDDVQQIVVAGLREIYGHWREACERDLGIEIDKGREWE